MTDKILNFFKKDPMLLPYVERICKDRPDLEDPFIIEEIANEMFLDPQWASTHTIDEIYEKAEQELDEAAAEALSFDLEDISLSEVSFKLNQERMEKLNRLGETLATVEPSVIISFKAELNIGSPNAFLCLDIPKSSCFVYRKSALELLSDMLRLSDDLAVSDSPAALRLSFGIRDVWLLDNK